MKTIFNLFLTLCICLPLFAQQSETRPHTDFSKLSIAVPADVTLSKGDFKVVIEGEELDEIISEVKGRELIIKHKNDRWSFFSNTFKKVRIHISMPELEAASLGGSGKLVSRDHFSSKNMKLRLSGSGNMELNFTTTNLDADVSGSGSMQLQFTADKADMSVSGSGGIKAAGTANSLKTRISGSGRVRGEDLHVQTVEARISGSGGCYVHVDEKIDASISGSGGVHYTGNPTEINARSSGSGKVKKRG